MSTDKNKIFNDLVKFYNELYSHLNGKDNQYYVADAWKVIKDIQDESEFSNAINEKKKEWKAYVIANERSVFKILFAKAKVKSSIGVSSLSPSPSSSSSILQDSSDSQEENVHEISISSSASLSL